MSYLVMLVVNDPNDVPEILIGWENAGALGITILNSTGIGHIRRSGLREDIPLMPSLSDLLKGEEILHRTIFSVVDDQEIVDRMVAVAQDVIGDLEDPHTGFLFVTPVLQAYGLGKHRLDRTKE